MPRESVKQILMKRDGMLEEDADNLINEFKEELNELLSGKNGTPFLEKAEQLVEDYFGLEPDYLDDFL